MEIFDFDDYKRFIAFVISKRPQKGYGENSKIAKALNIHTSLVSQILNGPKDFNYEQACELAHYLSLSELEEDYFLALVQLARAGTPRSRDKAQVHLKQIRKRSEKLKERISTETVLSDSDSATFFSNWYYAAVKLFVSLPEFKSVSEMAQQLRLPINLTNEVLHFLLGNGLLILENGTYKQGHSKIHIGADSPFVTSHHVNWRIKALEAIKNKSEDNLVFTMPANLSFSDAKKIRKALVKVIEECANTVDASKAETMFSLNIDWVKIVEKT